MTGLEPAGTSSTDWRLDHFAFMHHRRAGGRVRTGDLFVGNEALYRLRYACMSEMEELNLEGACVAAYKTAAGHQPTTSRDPRTRS